MDFFDLTDGPDSRTFNSGDVAGKPVRALGGSDTVTGSTDNEDINGNLGRDVIAGADGDDFMRGGQDDDTVRGDDGNDTVNGNLGNDIVDGGEGNDAVRGGQGDDALTGSDGDDTLFGDLEFDVLTGGFGADTFVLQRGKGQDTISDFTVGTDRLFTEDFPASDLTVTASGSNTLVTDKVTGQVVAVVQGVDSSAIANTLGIPIANPNDRLSLGAESTGGASSGEVSINPVTGTWASSTITGSGWTATGSLEAVNGFISFTVAPNQSNDLLFTLRVDPFLGTGFGSNSYNFPFSALPADRTFSIPITTPGEPVARISFI